MAKMTKTLNNLIAEINEIRFAARNLMNAVSGIREMRRNRNEDPDSETLFLEKAVYGSARRLLRLGKSVMKKWNWIAGLRGGKDDEIISDLEDIIEELRPGGQEDEGNTAGTGNISENGSEKEP